jgi:hypothetical protein
MNSLSNVDHANSPDGPSSAELSLRGGWKTFGLLGWGFVFIVCLVSFGSSMVSLHLWDSLPAANLPTYFQGITQTDIPVLAQFKDDVRGMVFSLEIYAGLFTAIRLIGCLPLFILSAALALRLRSNKMAMLFAIILAVMGAAGNWNDPLFPSATSLTPWMTIPTQVLNVLLWFGLIFLYVFPDGRFTPRWTGWILIGLIPITIARVFDLKIFLNPNTWPDLPALFPTVAFVGAAFFSVLFRYQHAENEVHKKQLRGYVVGVLMLIGLYFILFSVTEIIPTVTGINPFPTHQVGIVYALITEALWHGSQVIFAWGTARSLFQEKLLGK